MILPALRYRDVEAAVGFLVEAFGLTEHAVRRNEDGCIQRVELRHGNGLVILSGYRDDWMESKLPDQVGGVTGSIYLIVDDVDAHFERATKAGAQVARTLAYTTHGSREYSAWDLEGQLWHFGNFIHGE